MQQLASHLRILTYLSLFFLSLSLPGCGVEKVLQNVVEPIQQGSQPDTGLVAAFHASVVAGDLDQVGSMLARQPALINSRNGEQGTALLSATASGDVAMAKLLLANGANPNIGDAKGMTPLHRAAYAGGQQLVDLLLEHQADVNARTTGGATGEHHASGPRLDPMAEQSPSW